jgi:hypothetical protein
MTGAGSASVAYALESSFLGGVGGSPTYVAPGSNISVDTASIDNFLTEIREPETRTSVRSVAGRFEGALSVSFNLGPGASTDRADFHELIFNGTDGSGNDTLATGLPPSAEWYLGTDFERGGSISTAERVAKGWVCVQASVTYSEGDLVRVTLDGIYGDEASNTTLTPGSIARPGQEADFHEVDLTLDATTQTKLQSATLNLDGLARFERGTSRQPIAAVAGPANASLDVEAIFTEADQLEAAYGASGVTSVQDSIDAVDGQFTISPGGTAAADYSLSGLKPDSYEWTDLVTADTSLTEPVTFNIDTVTQQA